MRILFCQLAAAMTYCHKEHVVHRDLKCENILLDGEGKLKVTGEIKPRYMGMDTNRLASSLLPHITICLFILMEYLMNLLSVSAPGSSR